MRCPTQEQVEALTLFAPPDDDPDASSGPGSTASPAAGMAVEDTNLEEVIYELKDFQEACVSLIYNYLCVQHPRFSEHRRTTEAVELFSLGDDDESASRVLLQTVLLQTVLLQMVVVVVAVVVEACLLFGSDCGLVVIAVW